MHLLLMQPQPDLALAERVLDRLRHGVLHGFRHPDVEALAIEILRRRGTPIQVLPLEVPPLLRPSWDMLVQATAEQPSLIPPSSLATRIADRLWGASSWLIWEVPPEASPQPQSEEWLVPFIEANRRTASQPCIAEKSDRVIIGGVTLFKRGAHRCMEPRLGWTNEVSETRVEISASELFPGLEEFREGESPTSEYDTLERIFGNSDFRSVVQSLVENPAAARQRLTSLGFPAIRLAIESLLPYLMGVLRRHSLEGLMQESALDAAEFALLIQLEPLLQVRPQSAPTQARDPLALAVLVERLRLPAEGVQSTMVGLFLKFLAMLARRR